MVLILLTMLMMSRRLAGKQNRMKEADIDIREVHEDDMKGDPRVWLTKAMTEEQAPRPSGGS